MENPAGDCSVDVCLSKVMESIRAVVERHLPMSAEASLRLVETWDPSGFYSSSHDQLLEKPREQVSSGGRLLAAYAMATLGSLHFRADLMYDTLPEFEEENRNLDSALVNELRETTHK